MSKTEKILLTALVVQSPFCILSAFALVKLFFPTCFAA